MTRSSPFVLIALAVAAGIWFASQFPLPRWFIALALVIGLSMAAGAHQTRSSTEVVWSAAFAALVAFGALRYSLSAPTPADDSIARFNGQHIAVEGVIAEEPDVRPTFINLRVQPWRLLGASNPDEPLSDILLIRFDAATSATSATPWRYGDVVRVSGLIDAPPRLSSFDYRDYLARQGVFSWMAGPDALVRVDEGRGDWFYARLLSVKDAVRQTVQRILPAPESALLNGILIGDENAIPVGLKEAFRRTGTSHIVAISGFNVSIVIALVIPLLSRLLNPRRAAAFAMPAIVVYTLFVGASASVVRAAVMAGIGLVGALFWRKGFTLNTLCAAAFLMLIADPNTLFDVGFQLSFMATLGLVLYADRLSSPVRDWVQPRFRNEWEQRVAMLFIDGALVTLAAQITTLALLLTTYNQLSLVSLLANILILPLQPPIMILGGLAAAIGMLVPTTIGAVVALPVYAFLTATIRLAEWMASFDFAAIPIYGFGTPAALMYYVLLLTFTLAALQPPATRQAIAGLFHTRMGTAVVLSAGFIAIVLGGSYWFQRPDGKLHVTFVGSSAVLQSPSGKQVVFVGGGDLASVLGRTMPVWDRQVEVLIVPQREDRTRRNALPVLQRYQIETLIQPEGQDMPGELWNEWARAVEASVTGIVTFTSGASLEVDPGLSIVIEPRAPDRQGLQVIGARLIYGATEMDLIGNHEALDYPPGQDLIFVGPTQADPLKLNAARPRWVVWADAGGTPRRGLNDNIRVINLKTIREATCISDGEKLMFR